MDDVNIFPHPRQKDRNIRYTGDMRASVYGVFYLFHYVEKGKDGRWVLLRNEKHAFWLCVVCGDNGSQCNWQVVNSTTFTDIQFKHSSIKNQMSVNASFASTILLQSNINLSVDNVLSRLIADELNLEVTEITCRLRLSFSQTTSPIFYNFVWRCMRKAQLMPQKDVRAIFPKVSRQQRSEDTANLGRIKLEIVLPRYKYQRVFFFFFLYLLLKLVCYSFRWRTNWTVLFANCFIGQTL
jgi:hypothetical protein